MKVPKRVLLLVAAFVWLGAGTNILRIGVSSVFTVCRMNRFWVIALLACAAAFVYAGFFFMFRKVVSRHVRRILSYQEDKKSIFLFFDFRGYLLMAFMMGLGLVLRSSGKMPLEFFASFYTGLGAGLCTGGIRFLIAYFRK